MIKSFAVNKLTLVTDNDKFFRQRAHEKGQLFLRMANDMGGYDKMWQALVDLSEDVLSNSFLAARDNVRGIVEDLVDDVMLQPMIENYTSRKADVRIPYSEKEVLYPFIKIEMLKQFRASCYYHFLTDGDEKSAEKMVVRYLATPLTFKPMRDLS